MRCTPIDSARATDTLCATQTSTGCCRHTSKICRATHSNRIASRQSVMTEHNLLIRRKTRDSVIRLSGSFLGGLDGAFDSTGFLETFWRREA